MLDHMPQLHQITDQELNKAQQAADYLLTLNGKAPILEDLLAASLRRFQAELTEEHEGRRSTKQISRWMNSH